MTSSFRPAEAAPRNAVLRTPATPLLAASFLLAGMGTVVLGPLLPRLLAEWHLSDQRGGLLLLAKFVGAFVGGASVPRRLRLGIVAGHLLAAVGFAGFALAPGLPVALPALFLTGIGLGEIIASTNVLAGKRWAAHAGSVLALLNFFWSLGAVSTGILVAGLLPRFGWRRPVEALALLLAITGLLSLAVQTHSEAAVAPPDEASFAPFATSSRVFFVYGGLLLLYGGLETCLTAWLTTFSLRLTGGHLLGGQSGFVVLWGALTAGRVLASALLRRFREATVQRASLGLCLLLIGGLAFSHTGASLSISCVALGLALAPVFPATFGLLLRYDIQPRVDGRAFACGRQADAW